MKLKWVGYGLVALIFLGIRAQSPLYAAAYVNQSEIKFRNGSGWTVVSANSQTVLKAKSKLMLDNGLVVDDAVIEEISLLGTIQSFACSDSQVPAGWLPCDGRAVSRATYGSLYAKIGTTYGSGDGTSTFNLPDLRGVFVRGRDNFATSTAGHDPGGDRALGVTQNGATKYPASTVSKVTATDTHTHQYRDAWFSEAYFSSSYGAGPGTDHSGSAPSLVRNTDSTLDTGPGFGSRHGDDYGSQNRNDRTGWFGSAGSVGMSTVGAHTHTIASSSGVTGDAETRPLNAAVNFYIRY
ncbi:MAG: phage tail protein [Candidatus Margulisiibacteriota bacterium]